MSALRISGTELSKRVRTELAATVEQLTPKLGRAPRLAVVLVGDNPASQVYVNSKTKKAAAVGIDTVDVKLDGGIADEALQTRLRELSADPDLDGILLQLPLPKGLNEYEALIAIDPSKDVDGLHPVNQGLLLRGERCFRPCTPAGVMKLIDEANLQLSRPAELDGLHAVVVGRSILVGKPVAFMLLERNCTVTMCHSRSKDIESECRRADILIAAVGVPQLIAADWVKPGSIVVDVGINRLDSGDLVGDVDYDTAQAVAAAVTPVPGGVGPMTIAMLLANTVESAARKLE